MNSYLNVSLSHPNVSGSLSINVAALFQDILKTLGPIALQLLPILLPLLVGQPATAQTSESK